MNKNSFSVSFVILAAGKGSRMKSSKPKILHEVAGRAMIEHLLEMLKSFDAKIHCVLSNQNDQIDNYLKKLDYNLVIHKQKQQLGTADAVKVAVKSGAINSDYTIVLYGDTPFISNTLIEDLINQLKNGFAAAVVGFEYDEENQYGKLITKNEKLVKITEAIELGDKNSDYDLCNSGIMAFKTKALTNTIDKVNNNNKKGEYYLTDLVGLINNQGQKVGYVVTDYNEVLGVNDPLELAFAEEVFQINKISELLLNSVKVIKGEKLLFQC